MKESELQAEVILAQDHGQRSNQTVNVRTDCSCPMVLSTDIGSIIFWDPFGARTLKRSDMTLCNDQ